LFNVDEKCSFCQFAEIRNIISRKKSHGKTEKQRATPSPPSDCSVLMKNVILISLLEFASDWPKEKQ